MTTATHTIATTPDMLFASVPFGGDIHAEITRQAAEIGVDAPECRIADVYKGDEFDDAADRFRDAGHKPGEVFWSAKWDGTWIVADAA